MKILQRRKQRYQARAIAIPLSKKGLVPTRETAMILAILTLIMLSTFADLFAQGRIIIQERPPQLPSQPVYLDSVDARVNIRGGIANVTLAQSFYNPTGRQLEGEYLFSIPAEANIKDFYLYINGKKQAGEILDADKATKIYEQIVRETRDPALLTYAGWGLFKARIFPILPKRHRKIEISYAQVLPFENNLYKFILPVRQSGQQKINHFDLRIDIRDGDRLGTIYSPSHKISLREKDENHAIVRIESGGMNAGRDLLLYYSISPKKEINASSFSFRPRSDRDGFFMMMLSPGHVKLRRKPLPRDIIFVVDASGSMRGEKMDQAREALKYCVKALGSEDRFEIIRFSSTLEGFQGRLVAANRDNKENALYFIDELRARGGTNIDEALRRALSLKSRRDRRLTSILFMTDGLPTEGETDVTGILRNVKAQDRDFIRIFNFGVGYDVNTFLLDKLAEDSHGSSNYVKPGENIEREVSAFFAKNSAPVLTNPFLDFGDLAVYDVFPKHLPDVFEGQRLMVIGRYRRPGSSTVTLSGEAGAAERSFDYSINLPRRERSSDFVATLWANRKVDHLLNQIRFNGENPELVEAVKELGETYGIVTPYTAYLVQEQEEEVARQNRRRSEGRGSPMSRIAPAPTESDDLSTSGFYDALTRKSAPANSASGAGAVTSSRLRKKMADSEVAGEMLVTVKKVAGRTFTLKKGIWTENSLLKKHGGRNPEEIKFLSEGYFTLMKKDPVIREILALGDQVFFEWNGRLIKIIAG